jgi:hypothetical protein
MHAHIGDHLLVPGHKVGEASRECEVVEVLGTDGTPPYVVKWADGHSGVYFPASDAHLVSGSPRQGW